MGADFDDQYFDTNAGEDGLVSKDQLLAYFMQREKLRVAFDQIDTDRSGFIDKDEMRHLFAALEMPQEKMESLMKQIDGDGDGKVSFKEFASNVNLGGGRSFEKALTKAMEAGGRIKGVLTLQGMFDR